MRFSLSDFVVKVAHVCPTLLLFPDKNADLTAVRPNAYYMQQLGEIFLKDLARAMLARAMFFVDMIRVKYPTLYLCVGRISSEILHLKYGSL